MPVAKRYSVEEALSAILDGDDNSTDSDSSHDSEEFDRDVHLPPLSNVTFTKSKAHSKDIQSENDVPVLETLKPVPPSALRQNIEHKLPATVGICTRTRAKPSTVTAKKSTIAAKPSAVAAKKSTDPVAAKPSAVTAKKSTVATKPSAVTAKKSTVAANHLQ